MKLRTVLPLLAALAAAGPAAADPIIAKDALGQEYQLNDDGSYARIVRNADGKIFLLSQGGTWYGQDDGKMLSDRFAAEFDKAIAAGKGPAIDKEKIPAYRECIVAAFNRYPMDARRMLMSAGGDGAIDIQRNFEKLQKAMPEVADSLNKDDNRCRNG
ncbi:MAG TPA: hypothetical protein VFB16_06675 [Bauldia sp.]|nr:hypothetical protein [Bauldia sp.]